MTLKSQNSEPIYISKVNPNDDTVLVVETYDNHGLYVNVGEPILAVETSKAIEVIDAPASGYLYLSAAKGDTISTGEVAGEIYSSKELWEAKQTSNLPTQKNVGNNESHSMASKKAMELAQKLNIDISNIKKGGLIKEIDVKNYFDSVNNLIERAEDTSHQSFVKLNKFQSGVIKTINISQNTTIPSYLFSEISIPLINSPKYKWNDVVLFTASKILPKYKNLNAFYESQTESIVQSRSINFGFTIDVEGKLYMGVIANCESKTLKEISEEKFTIALNLNRGEADQGELFNPTVCISTLEGKYIRHQIPILYPKTSLIIGLNTSNHNDNQLSAYFSFVYDHQITSGQEILNFSEELIEASINNYLNQLDYK